MNTISFNNNLYHVVKYSTNNYLRLRFFYYFYIKEIKTIKTKKKTNLLLISKFEKKRKRIIYVFLKLNISFKYLTK